MAVNTLELTLFESRFVIDVKVLYATPLCFANSFIVIPFLARIDFKVLPTAMKSLPFVPEYADDNDGHAYNQGDLNRN